MIVYLFMAAYVMSVIMYMAIISIMEVTNVKNEAYDFDISDFTFKLFCCCIPFFGTWELIELTYRTLKLSYSFSINSFVTKLIRGKK